MGDNLTVGEDIAAKNLLVPSRHGVIFRISESHNRLS
jgi:hypothetical protein